VSKKVHFYRDSSSGVGDLGRHTYGVKGKAGVSPSNGIMDPVSSGIIKKSPGKNNKKNCNSQSEKSIGAKSFDEKKHCSSTFSKKLTPEMEAKMQSSKRAVEIMDHFSRKKTAETRQAKKDIAELKRKRDLGIISNDKYSRGKSKIEKRLKTAKKNLDMIRDAQTEYETEQIYASHGIDRQPED